MAITVKIVRHSETHDRVRAEVREKIEAGWQDIQAGRTSDGEPFMQALLAKLEDDPSQESA